MGIYSETLISIDGSEYGKTTLVDAVAANLVVKNGDTMSGILDMSGNKITNVADPLLDQDAATKNYVDVLANLKLDKSGVI